jgi:hypothetical protein
MSSATLEALNRRLRSRAKRTRFVDSLKTRYYRFQDLFESAHETGFEVIGGALQASVVALIIVVAMVQIIRSAQAHHALIHFLGR